MDGREVELDGADQTDAFVKTRYCSWPAATVTGVKTSLVSGMMGTARPTSDLSEAEKCASYRFDSGRETPQSTSLEASSSNRWWLWSRWMLELSSSAAEASCDKAMPKNKTARAMEEEQEPPSGAGGGLEDPA